MLLVLVVTLDSVLGIFFKTKSHFNWKSIRMLLILLCGMFSLLPMNSALINCRLACRRCKENAAYPEMLEVYCAMCDECKERRREWLQDKRNLRTNSGNHLKSDSLDEYQDECAPHTDDPCEEQISLPEKTTATTTTTTSSTTHRPCYPKTHCAKTTKTPCYPMPCPILPLAMPVCPTCPIVGTVSTVSSPSVPPTLSHDKKVVDSVTATSDSIFFYVGVPKKLLKDLKLLHP